MAVLFFFFSKNLNILSTNNLFVFDACKIIKNLIFPYFFLLLIPIVSNKNK